MKAAAIAFALVLAPVTWAGQASGPETVSKPTIEGKVLQEPDGSPIRKANVQFNGLPEPGQPGRMGAQYAATSDAQGRFTIVNVEPGHYLVTVEHAGFVESGGGRRRPNITVQAGSGKNDLILHMQPAAIITGKIVDVDGDAMGGVSVTAVRIGPAAGRIAHGIGNAVTNDLGEFRISELRAGRYKVTAAPAQGARVPDSKDGGGREQLVYLPTHYPGVLNEEQAAAVEVHAGAEARVNFGLLTGRAYHISGSVTGISSKSGMAQIMLEGTGGGGSPSGPQQVGPSGKFEFKDVMPGTYVARLITITFEGGQPAMQMQRLGQPIEVRNAPVEGLVLQAEAGGDVRGKFRLDSEQKFDWTQLSVILMPADDGEMRAVGMSGEGFPNSSQVSADGTFEMKNVPGGTYQLVVGANSDKLADYFTKSVKAGGRDVTDSGFAVSTEAYLDVEVSGKGATITGKVVDDKGQPVANANVVDIPSAEHRGRPDLYQRSTSDASGNFSLRGLSAGTYTVLAFEELQGDVRQPEFLKSNAARGEKVELEEGARKSVVIKVIASEAETP